MKEAKTEIILLDSLCIGFSSGRHVNPILPPLSASSTGGELIAVIGRNGIGKSTLLRTITGLQPSLGGEIFIHGRSTIEYTRMEMAKMIGYISTEVVRVSNMKVCDLVALGRFPHTNWLGQTDQSDRIAVENAIDRTGLALLSNRNISELSDGERQKAMIARVLAQDTDLLIMDEPTAFLDIASKFEIISLMLELTRDGKTIVFSTHDFNIAVSQADKIWLILDDRLAEGSPEDLMLSGSFEHLFDSSVIKFSSSDGSFVFRNESRGTLFIKGEGIIRKWTERALSRVGYEVSDSMTNPYILVSGFTDKQWKLVSGSNEKDFSSIYDLIRGLRK
jgi:iron complex transport system ATP-binding protein